MQGGIKLRGIPGGVKNKGLECITLLAVGVGPSRPRLGLQMGGDDPQAQPTENNNNQKFHTIFIKQTKRGWNQNGTIPAPYPKQTTHYSTINTYELFPFLSL